MSDLRNVISQLASQFANGVLEAIRGASLEDILLETRTGDAAPARAPARAAAPGAPAGPKAVKKSGRLERRSDGEIAEVVAKIVGLLGQNAKGLRAEEIRSKLGLDAKELPRPIAQALAERKITKVGEKRATTYFAGAGKVAPATVPTATAKSAAPSATKPREKATKGRAATRPAAVAPASKPSQSKVIARKAHPAKGATAAKSAPKAKGAVKADAPAPKASAKGKKSSKTPDKTPLKGIGGHKPLSIEEAVTIVTTGAPEDISG